LPSGLDQERCSGIAAKLVLSEGAVEKHVGFPRMAALAAGFGPRVADLVDAVTDATTCLTSTVASDLADRYPLGDGGASARPRADQA
jgi:hypothetical protein